MYGIILAVIEISLFIIGSILVKYNIESLKPIPGLVYYWSMFTILTGVWEVFFILNYDYVRNDSINFIKNKTHVWTSNYNVSYLLPWKFSDIFYAEYGAYADREYMALGDDWSRTIESTHAIFCGIFSFYSILLKAQKYEYNYLIAVGVAMGSQLMNSILYLINYFIEVNNVHSVNNDTPDFPAGQFLCERPFMYVNVFWFLMPSLIIFIELINNYKKKDREYSKV
jgi:hypothetical protein